MSIIFLFIYFFCTAAPRIYIHYRHPFCLWTLCFFFFQVKIYFVAVVFDFIHAIYKIFVYVQKKNTQANTTKKTYLLEGKTIFWRESLWRYFFLLSIRLMLLQNMYTYLLFPSFECTYFILIDLRCKHTILTIYLMDTFIVE